MSLYILGLGLEITLHYARVTIGNPEAPRASFTLERDHAYTNGDKFWQPWHEGNHAAGLFAGPVSLSAYRRG